MTPIGAPVIGPVGLTAAIYAGACSPDGNTLAVGSGDDTVQLWNVTDPADAIAIGQPLTSVSLVLAVVESGPAYPGHG